MSSRRRLEVLKTMLNGRLFIMPDGTHEERGRRVIVASFIRDIEEILSHGEDEDD